MECNDLAEEKCALGEHETVNIVVCTKHHLEVPCKECTPAPVRTPKEKEKESQSQETARKDEQAVT